MVGNLVCGNRAHRIGNPPLVFLPLLRRSLSHSCSPFSSRITVPAPNHLKTPLPCFSRLVFSIVYQLQLDNVHTQLNTYITPAFTPSGCLTSSTPRPRFLKSALNSRDSHLLSPNKFIYTLSLFSLPSCLFQLLPRGLAPPLSSVPVLRCVPIQLEA